MMMVQLGWNNVKRDFDKLKDRVDINHQDANTRLTILEERSQSMFHRIDHVDGEVIELRKDINKVSDMVIDIRSLIQNNIITEGKMRLKMLIGGGVILLSIIYPDIANFISKLH